MSGEYVQKDADRIMVADALRSSPLLRVLCDDEAIVELADLCVRDGRRYVDRKPVQCSNGEIVVFCGGGERVCVRLGPLSSALRADDTGDSAWHLFSAVPPPTAWLDENISVVRKDRARAIATAWPLSTVLAEAILYVRFPSALIAHEYICALDSTGISIFKQNDSAKPVRQFPIVSLELIHGPGEAVSVGERRRTEHFSGRVYPSSGRSAADAVLLRTRDANAFERMWSALEQFVAARTKARDEVTWTVPLDAKEVASARSPFSPQYSPLRSLDEKKETFIEVKAPCVLGTLQLLGGKHGFDFNTGDVVESAARIYYTLSIRSVLQRVDRFTLRRMGRLVDEHRRYRVELALENSELWLTGREASLADKCVLLHWCFVHAFYQQTTNFGGIIAQLAAKATAKRMAEGSRLRVDGRMYVVVSGQLVERALGEPERRVTVIFSDVPQTEFYCVTNVSVLCVAESDWRALLDATEEMKYIHAASKALTGVSTQQGLDCVSIAAKHVSEGNDVDVRAAISFKNAEIGRLREQIAKLEVRERQMAARLDASEASSLRMRRQLQVAQREHEERTATYKEELAELRSAATLTKKKAVLARKRWRRALEIVAGAQRQSTDLHIWRQRCAVALDALRSGDASAQQVVSLWRTSTHSVPVQLRLAFLVFLRRSASAAWCLEFAALFGFGALLDDLARLEQGGPIMSWTDAAARLCVVRTLRLLARRRGVIDLVTRTDGGARLHAFTAHISSSNSSSAPLCQREALRLCAIVALTPARSLLLDALSAAARVRGDANRLRFEPLLQILEFGRVVDVKVAVMMLLNALLANTESFDTRVQLHDELSALGVEHVVRSLRIELADKSIQSVELLHQLKAFDAQCTRIVERRVDIEQALDVDVESSLSIVQRMLTLVRDTSYERYLRQILMHLLLIANDKCLGALAWPLLLNVMHRLALVTEHTEAKRLEGATLDDVSRLLERKRALDDELARRNTIVHAPPLPFTRKVVDEKEHVHLRLDTPEVTALKFAFPRIGLDVIGHVLEKYNGDLNRSAADIAKFLNRIKTVGAWARRTSSSTSLTSLEANALKETDENALESSSIVVGRGRGVDVRGGGRGQDGFGRGGLTQGRVGRGGVDVGRGGVGVGRGQAGGSNDRVGVAVGAGDVGAHAAGGGLERDRDEQNAIAAKPSATEVKSTTKGVKTTKVGKTKKRGNKPTSTVKRDKATKQRSEESESARRLSDPLPPPSGAPPPPPAPPVKRVFKSKRPAPACTLKALFWTVLHEHQISESSGWTKVVSDDFCWLSTIGSYRVELSEELRARVEAHFAQTVRQEDVASAHEQSMVAMHTGNGHIQLLERRRATNIGVVLKRFSSLSIKKLVSIIGSGDTLAFSVDELLVLKRIAPDEHDASIVAHYDGDVSQLAAAERFVHATLLVPNFSQKIETLSLCAEFDSLASDVMSALETVIGACRWALRSDMLMAALACVLEIGNFVNYGNVSRGNAHAFALDALDKLAEARATSHSEVPSNFTLMHIVAETIGASSLRVKVLRDQCPQLHDVAQMPLAELVDLVTQLRTRVGDACADMKASSGPFVTNVKPLLDRFEAEMSVISSQLVSMQKLSDELKVSFGAPSADDVFSALDRFFIHLAKACEELEDYEKAHESSVDFDSDRIDSGGDAASGVQTKNRSVMRLSVAQEAADVLRREQAEEEEDIVRALRIIDGANYDEFLIN